MAETGARKVAREEAMARERQAAEAAISRNNNRRTRSNGVKSKISTIPQAQHSKRLRSDCQPKDNQDLARLGNECCKRKKVQLLKAGLVYGTWWIDIEGLRCRRFCFPKSAILPRASTPFPLCLKKHFCAA